jgi:hypothetical protein
MRWSLCWSSSFWLCWPEQIALLESQWVGHRKELLAKALRLAEARVQHPRTSSRILGQVVQVKELEQVVREYYAESPQWAPTVVIAMDGITLRGRIRTGDTDGLHRLAA